MSTPLHVLYIVLRMKSFSLLQQCKEVENHPLCELQLKNHAHVLYGLCTHPVMNKTPEWSEFCENLKTLDDYFSKYTEYLNEQSRIQFQNR